MKSIFAAWLALTFAWPAFAAETRSHEGKRPAPSKKKVTPAQRRGIAPLPSPKPQKRPPLLRKDASALEKRGIAPLPSPKPQKRPPLLRKDASALEKRGIAPLPSP